MDLTVDSDEIPVQNKFGDLLEFEMGSTQEGTEVVCDGGDNVISPIASFGIPNRDALKVARDMDLNNFTASGMFAEGVVIMAAQVKLGVERG